MKRGKKSYAEKRIAQMDSELLDLRLMREMVINTRMDLLVTLSRFEYACKMFDSFTGEWEKETRHIKDHARDRLYFGRHFYPELMMSELKYLSGDLQRMINVHERHLIEFQREQQEECV